MVFAAVGLARQTLPHVSRRAPNARAARSCASRKDPPGWSSESNPPVVAEVSA
jgi:hypothetical protein